MRVSVGLGLVTVVGLIACATVSDDPSAPTAAGQAPGNGTNTGGNGGNTSPSTDPPESATPPAAEDPNDPEAPPGPVLSGIAITDVAVFQAVKVPVVQAGKYIEDDARKAPVVANRPGLLRVYVTPGSGWTARDVTAELRLVSGDKKFPVIRATKRISGVSKDDDPNTTLDLELPAESLPTGVTFQVALTGADGEASPKGDVDGRYPRDGSFKDLGAVLSGKMKVVLVPIKYDADGSGRAPDMGTSQLDLYKKVMMAWYPTSEVEVKAHEPYPWTTKISNNGNGFQQALRAITQLRQDENAERDVYYYGVFSPSASFKAYCQGGCVTGLSMIVEKDNPSLRASVGLGFTGVDSAQTMGHELGHAHGRQHSPCGGAQGTDPKYPYQQAQIGVWGYNILDKTFIAPTKGRDMMGYCPNQWVSDYTYNALFERISSVSLTKDVAFAWKGERRPQTKTTYRLATVSGAGDLSWDGDLDVDEELTGGTVSKARFLAESGNEVLARDTHFYRFDHLPGGFLFVPAERAVNWKAVEIGGFTQRLAR